MIDQIIKHDSAAWGDIDIVCTEVQAEIFRSDPRIGSIILVPASIFATPNVATWGKGLFFTQAVRELLRTINRRGYQAVFPGNTTPFFYRQVRAPLIKMQNLKLFKVFRLLQAQETIPFSAITRDIIDTHFGHSGPIRDVEEKIPLYLSSQAIEQAATMIREIKAQSGVFPGSCRLLVVAADTSSAITRPPTSLLEPAIVDTLAHTPSLLVCILPGYTDCTAAGNLYQTLALCFGARIVLFPSEPRPSLSLLMALIDRADVFVTGDTGLMHLAVARKEVYPEEQNGYVFRNTTKVIALFGGTHPGLFGYDKLSVILGRGRKEQSRLIPGIFKEAYLRRRDDWFDHILPQQVAKAILDQLTMPPVVCCAQAKETLEE
jgi:hypothetical protein